MNIKDKTVLVTGANRGIGRWQPKPWPEAPSGYTSAPASRWPTQTSSTRRSERPLS